MLNVLQIGQFKNQNIKIGYARVSTKQQCESLDLQILQLKKFGSEIDCFIAVRWYQKIGLSFITTQDLIQLLMDLLLMKFIMTN